MVLQITNTCRMMCPHCFQCSTPKSQHMSEKVLNKALEFLDHYQDHTIIVSGGEPTEHPDWIKFVSKVCDRTKISVTLGTNGMWLYEPEKITEMIKLLQKYPKLGIQLTSYKGLYQNCDEIRAKCKSFMLTLKELKLKHRVILDTDRERDLHLLELGRCKENFELAKEARADNRSTTSCAQFVTTLVQMGSFKTALFAHAMNGKFCTPFISWKGNLHMSESWLCPHFADVFDKPEKIEEKALKWRPCGKCAGYQKLLARDDGNYPRIKQLLGIKK